MFNKIMLSKTKKLLSSLAIMVLFCGNLYGYKLILVNDSKTKGVFLKFVTAKKTHLLKTHFVQPGLLLCIDNANPNEKLEYKRSGGYVDIKTEFKAEGKSHESPLDVEKLSFKDLSDKDCVVIRFLEKTGYRVNIFQDISEKNKSLRFTSGEDVLVYGYGKVFECTPRGSCKEKFDKMILIAKELTPVKIYEEIKRFVSEFIEKSFYNKNLKELKRGIERFNSNTAFRKFLCVEKSDDKTPVTFFSYIRDLK